MSSHTGSGAGWRRLVPMWIAACLFSLACGPESPSGSEQAPAEQVNAAVEDSVAPEAGLRPFLPDEMQRSTRAESFPHGAHGPISCAVCHEVPQGHGSHEGVACADCHRAGGSTTVVAPTPTECQSCHHGVDQQVTCESCHESRPTVTSVQEVFFEVWREPRTRALEFDHGLHADVSCESCHRALPALTPAEPCASCHVDHHTPDVRCASCHVPPPEGAHDVEAHLTCSGSGCHRNREVEAMASQRPVCLACHVEQEEHEPGGDCVQCHQMRAEP